VLGGATCGYGVAWGVEGGQQRCRLLTLINVGGSRQGRIARTLQEDRGSTCVPPGALLEYTKGEALSRWRREGVGRGEGGGCRVDGG